jgi:5-methylcytosine-specific restriction endonuclease McrA
VPPKGWRGAYRTADERRRDNEEWLARRRDAQQAKWDRELEIARRRVASIAAGGESEPSPEPPARSRRARAERPPRPPHGKRGAAPTPAMLAEMAYRASDPCPYCGDPSEHWDHMHSRHRGGWNEPDNLIRACKRCNVSKRTLSPLRYLVERVNGRRA